jgi:hypothetical protein
MEGVSLFELGPAPLELPSLAESEFDDSMVGLARNDLVLAVLSVSSSLREELDIVDEISCEAELRDPVGDTPTELGISVSAEVVPPAGPVVGSTEKILEEVATVVLEDEDEELVSMVLSMSPAVEVMDEGLVTSEEVESRVPLKDCAELELLISLSLSPSWD